MRNSSRFYLEQFIRSAAASVRESDIVLDAGAGDCRYSVHFDHVLYESTDFAQVEKSYGELTYVCDITDLPVEDGRFSLVLCTQVLAHLPDPCRALRELARVLKPGGKLWLTAPLFFQENEKPYDFFRYTQFGLRHVFEESGFRVDRLDWLEGYCGTVSYQLGMASHRLPVSPKAYGGGLIGLGMACLTLGIRPLFALMSLIYGTVDRRHAFREAGMCKNYAVVATRIMETSR